MLVAADGSLLVDAATPMLIVAAASVLLVVVAAPEGVLPFHSAVLLLMLLWQGWQLRAEGIPTVSFEQFEHRLQGSLSKPQSWLPRHNQHRTLEPSDSVSN